MHKLWTRIHDLRVERGMTLTELSRVSGVSRGYLHLLQKGTNNPTYEKMVQIANALKVPIAELTDGNENIIALTEREAQLIHMLRSDNLSGALHAIADWLKP